MQDYNNIDRYAMIQRLQHNNGMPDIDGGNALVTAVVFAITIMLVALCIWAGMTTCVPDEPRPAVVADSHQEYMEAISWARHYEGRGRK